MHTDASCAVLLGLTIDLTFEHYLRPTGKFMNHGIHDQTEPKPHLDRVFLHNGPFNDIPS